MKSNYQPIGKYIREVSVRNNDLRTTNLLGINIDKYFMPSVANIVGTDLSVYKIVKKWQFACNRMHVGRDGRLPIALSTYDDEFIVSPAYNVFEIIGESILSPEYLMMWFTRSEFDRNACFYTDADVRAGLSWEAFSGMKLPVPHIDKQREIVQEYKAITDRIELNKKLCLKLEETAQAIYREWFVDFEFPNEDGKPYKSSGGEMIESELGEIPIGWRVNSFTKVINLSGGGTPSTDHSEYWGGCIPFYTPGDLNSTYYTIETEKSITELGLKKCSSKLYPKNTVFVTARGATVGGIALSGNPMAMNQTCYAISANNNRIFFVHQLSLRIISKLKNEASGATFEALVTKNFDTCMVIEPQQNIIESFNKTVDIFYENNLLKTIQNEKLSELKELLLSKLTKIGG